MTTEQLLEAYEGFGDDALALLSCMENPSRWDLNVVYPGLPSYVKGRVALLGDAVRLADSGLKVGVDLQ